MCSYSCIEAQHTEFHLLRWYGVCLCSHAPSQYSLHQNTFTTHCSLLHIPSLHSDQNVKQAPGCMCYSESIPEMTCQRTVVCDLNMGDHGGLIMSWNAQQSIYSRMSPTFARWHSITGPEIAL